MSNIKILKTEIDGLFIIEPTIYTDNRGNLFEAYNESEFESHNLRMKFVQDNEVFSKKMLYVGCM